MTKGRESLPWLIVGTGPTFEDVRASYGSQTPADTQFRIITLNRAITSVRYADCAALSHLTTLLAIREHLSRAELCIISDPFLNDDGTRSPATDVAKSIPTRVEWFPRKSGFHHKDKIEQGFLCCENTVANFALSWAVKQGATSVTTAGIDGGEKMHDVFRGSYANHPKPGNYGFQVSKNSFMKYAKQLGVTVSPYGTTEA